MKKPTDIQIVKFNGSKGICKHCKTVITDVNNMTYLKIRWGEPKHWDELSKCDKCGHQFLLRHDIFDKKGHILPFVFTGDINNPKYNWTDNLNEKQKLTIAKHIEKCSTCQKLSSEQILSDARLKEFFMNLRKKG